MKIKKERYIIQYIEPDKRFLVKDSWRSVGCDYMVIASCMDINQANELIVKLKEAWKS